jgi:hypothetical protein
MQVDECADGQTDRQMSINALRMACLLYLGSVAIYLVGRS